MLLSMTVHGGYLLQWQIMNCHYSSRNPLGISSRFFLYNIVSNHKISDEKSDFHYFNSKICIMTHHDVLQHEKKNNNKKCILTLAMSPTCHSNNTITICWHEFFRECSQSQFGSVPNIQKQHGFIFSSYKFQRVASVKLDLYRKMSCWFANFFRV